MWHFYDGIEGRGRQRKWGPPPLSVHTPKRRGGGGNNSWAENCGGKEEEEGLDFNSPATIFHPCGSGRPTVVVDREDGRREIFFHARPHSYELSICVAPRE